jgi:hydroxypyruvate isomerase
LIANLRWALTEAPGQSLTIEPMCQDDVPGYYLNNALKATDIVKEISDPHLGLQFDTHHVQQIHGAALQMWEVVADHVHHVQIAQSPARMSPDQVGEIDMTAFLSALSTAKYKGWVAGEYLASPDDTAHRFWLP